MYPGCWLIPSLAHASRYQWTCQWTRGLDRKCKETDIRSAGCFSVKVIIYENTPAFDPPCFCKIFKVLKRLQVFFRLNKTKNVYCILVHNCCVPCLLAEIILYDLWWHWRENCLLSIFPLVELKIKMARKRNKHGCSKKVTGRVSDYCQLECKEF